VPAVGQAPGEASTGPGGERVAVSLRSVPAGAEVFRADTGESLGTTPLRLEQPRTVGTLPVRVALPGHRTRELEVALDRDADLELALEPSVAARKRAAGQKSRELSKDAILDPYAQ
jgi:hypothetical protein